MPVVLEIALSDDIEVRHLSGPSTLIRASHLSRGDLDCLENLRVSRAAAEVARQSISDLVARGIVVLGKKRGCAHQHSRRAVAALGPSGERESPLNGARLTTAGEPFDGYHRPFLCLHGKIQAGHDRGTV